MDYLNIISVLTILVFTFFWINTHKIRDKLLYLLIAFNPIFSANFEFPFFRPIFQSLLVIILIFNIVYWIKRGVTLTNVGFLFFSYLILIIISYIGNDIILDTYSAALINYGISVSTVLYIFRKLNTKEKMFKLFDFFAYLTVILGIFSIIEKILVGGRTETTFSNPNYLAFFLGIGFIWILIYNRSKWRYLNLSVIGMGIFSTESRIIILAVALISFFYFFKSLKKKSFLKILPIYLIFGIILFITFQGFSESRFGTEMAISSDMERNAIMVVSLNIIKEEPLNGIGYGQFIDKFSEYLAYGSPIAKALSRRDQIVTHNDYLRIVDELGIPALLLFMTFVFYVYLKGIKKGNIVWYIFTYVLIFSVAHNNMNAFLFWFLLFLPIHYLSLEKRENKRKILEDS